MTVFVSEQATAEQDEEDDKCADIKSEQSAVENNHKQDYNPQYITTCVALGWFVVIAAAACSAKTAQSAK